MTDYHMYTIFDTKSDLFLTPTPSLNDATAYREFYRMLKTVPSMGVHASDYLLYECGTFDTSNAVLTQAHKLRLIGNGLSCLKSIEQEFENHETAQSQESTSPSV